MKKKPSSRRPTTRRNAHSAATQPEGDARLDNPNAEGLAADIRAIAKRAAAQIKRPYVDHAEYLYDEHGLPK